MIKSIDINYGFNGEVSTASVSYSGSETKCKATSIDSTIDKSNILQGFKIFKTTTTNEAGFISKSEEYIDEYAQKLESIAVLVRGITASPYQDWKQFHGRMYNFAETDIVEIGEKGKILPEIIGNILILGRTISVVSATEGNDQYYKYYAGGAIVGRNPKGEFPKSVQEKFEDLDVTASLKHGYYSNDLRSGLTALGYSLVNFPEDDEFTLFETGGSLKDCISALASTYGLYWTCRGSKIRFFTKNEIINIEVQDFTSSNDNRIISASFSQDNFNKTKIGVIRGSISETDNSGGGGGTGSSAKNKSIYFGFLTPEFLVKQKKDGLDNDINVIRHFYSFFKFGGGEELFNLIFFILLFENVDNFTAASCIKNYELQNQFNSKESLSIEDFPESVRDEASKFLKKDDSFYDIQTANGDGDLPTRTNLYQIIKSACECYSSIFISKPVSKRTALKYSVTPTEGYRVSVAYKGSEKIKDISELSSYYTALKGLLGSEAQDFSNVTLIQLSNAINSTGEGEFTLADPYIYVAIKDLIESPISFEKAQKAAKDCISAEDPMPAIPLEIYDKKIIPFSKKRATSIAKMISTSKSLVSSIEEKIGSGKIRMRAVQLADEEAEDTGNELTNDDKVKLLNYSEIKSFGVNVYNGGNLSTVDVVTLDCNIDEQSYLNKQFLNISPASVPQKSSSVTFIGYEAPPIDDPAISSYSISISDSSVRTTIGYSTKEVLGIDQSIVMSNYTSNGSKNINKQFKARQKNFLGLN